MVDAEDVGNNVARAMCVVVRVFVFFVLRGVVAARETVCGESVRALTLSRRGVVLLRDTMRGFVFVVLRWALLFVVARAVVFFVSEFVRVIIFFCGLRVLLFTSRTAPLAMPTVANNVAIKRQAFLIRCFCMFDFIKKAVLAQQNCNKKSAKADCVNCCCPE